jgi:hypothetical protein
MQSHIDTSVKVQGPRIRKLRSLKGANAALFLTLFTCCSCASSFANQKSQQLAVSSASIDFGSVEVGVSSTQLITVTNTGRSNAIISAVTIIGTGFTYSGPVLPLTLSRRQSANLSITFLPSAPGAAMGSLTLSSAAPVSPNMTSLVGTGVQTASPAAQPALSTSPAIISFGKVLVGSSNSQSVTISNTSSISLSISQAAVSGSCFGVSGLALPLTLAPGQSSSFTTSFTPGATGSMTGGITLISDAANSPTPISISGAGVQPLISVVPTSVSFSNVTVGQTNTQTVTLSNPGTANLTVTQTAGPGTGFSLSGLTMPLTVPPGRSAKFSLSFTPTVAGSLTSSVALVSNAPASPMSVSVSGAGVQPSSPQISVTPGGLAFGSVTVGGSGKQSLTVSNTGSAGLSIAAANVTGSGFSTSGLSLPMTVAVGGSGTITVDFAPSTSGSVIGSLSLASNAPTSPTAIALSGSGVAPTLQLSASPTSLNFGSEAVGTSGTQNVTLTNDSSSGSITVSAITISGPFASTGVTLPVTLNAAESQTLNVTFTPTASGAATGTLTITSTAGNSPTTVTLAGTGTSTAGTTIPATFWGMHVNKYPSYPLQIPYGQFRSWDAGASQWPSVETCQAASGSPSDSCFTWSGLDTQQADLKNDGVNDVLYTLSRTPAWGSQNATDANCNYYGLGGNFKGACYPPTDLNSDGTGTNQIWKNWVTAIATHANDATYLQTHAHIKYWEIWNEFYRSTTLGYYSACAGCLSWQGTYNQLVRLAEDARCIITGTGSIRNTPSLGSSTACSATAIDPTAKIVSPSTAANYPGGIKALQNFLYCNNSPAAACTVGSAGAAAVDVIDAHLYAEGRTPESVASSDVSNLRSALESAELAKPLWNGESSWGIPTLTNSIWKDGYARAGFIPRFFALYWSAGVTENFWYSYDTDDGQLYDPVAGHLLKPEATAWTSTYNWLVGAVPTQTPFCQTSGTIYFCDFGRANGYVARLVWDSQFGQNCAQMDNPVICGNTTYNVPSQFNRDWVDVLGAVHPQSGTVMIGANPILLEGQQ